MLTYKKITSYKELDEILAMCKKLHESCSYGKLFPYSAYLQWLTTTFPFLGIWVVYETGEQWRVPVGYLIAGVQFTYCEKECIIYEAYTDQNVELNSEIFDCVTQWAKEQGCSFLSCFTENKAAARLFSNKYKFTETRIYLTKTIGG